MISVHKIIIGTRGSALALKQSKIVAQALKRAYPSLVVEVRTIITHGDENQGTIPLDTIGKGWFTQEIENELTSGGIDIAVHSLKDMAEEMPSGLIIAAYPEREDARDVLVSRQGEILRMLPSGALVGTDSVRRKVQLLALRSDLRIESIRGNVPTRLEKLDSGGYDAVVLAAAGLKRLHLEKRVQEYFDVADMTPAPGQGILAIEARAGDHEILTLLNSINNADAAVAARLERTFAATVGGGCKSPTGAYAFQDGNSMHLVGMIEQDGIILREEMSAVRAESEDLGKMLAAQMLGHRNDVQNS